MENEHTPSQPDQAEMERFQELLRSEIRKEVEAVFKSQKPDPVAKPTTQEQDAFREVLTPYIEPGLSEARFKADNAMDDARFYRRNPDALKYEEKIEDLFERLQKAGRAIARQDIYDKIIGQELREKPEEVYKRMEEAHKAALERAQSAVDITGSALGKTKPDPRFDNFASKTLAEMEEALEGFAF